MILAATVANTLDVDAMLDSVTPKQFSEWIAFYTICPWAVGQPIQKPKEDTSFEDSLAGFRRLAGV